MAQNLEAQVADLCRRELSLFSRNDTCRDLAFVVVASIFSKACLLLRVALYGSVFSEDVSQSWHFDSIGMRLFLLICVLCASQLTSAAAADPIRGTIESPFADQSSKLSIVAYARNGMITDQAPVTHDASFTLHRLANKDGDHVLHVLGAMEEDYDPQFVRIIDGRIHAVEILHDPLILPDPQDLGDTSFFLTFAPVRKTKYTRKKRPWRLKDLWASRIRLLQLAAVAFVVWFPHYIRSLPKEIRDELMGEKEEDVGDVTAVFCALSGYKEPTSDQSASTISKR